MQVTMREKNRVWVGAPRLERVMGIDHGLVVLRSRNWRLLNKLVATALVKNNNPDAKTFYLYAAPEFLNANVDFITTVSNDLGLDKDALLRSVRFVNFSTASPTRLHELWSRVEQDADDTNLIVVDSLGHHAGRDSYIAERVTRLCYEQNALAIVLDASEELDPTLEKRASIVVDLNAKGEGVEVFLRKHPKLQQTVFLMSA